MAAAAPRTFFSIVEQPDTVQLQGAAAQVPIAAGQMIIGHCTFTDGTATGPGIFLVLRQLSTKTYLLAPFGTTDGDWSKWLSDKSTVKAVLWRSPKDVITDEDELLRRWRVVSGKGEEPKKSDYESFGKKIADGVAKKWAFFNDLVVSDKPPPQAATVPHFSVSVKYK